MLLSPEMPPPASKHGSFPRFPSLHRLAWWSPRPQEAFRRAYTCQPRSSRNVAGKDLEKGEHFLGPALEPSGPCMASQGAASWGLESQGEVGGK